jgi:hypothetical protein
MCKVNVVHPFTTSDIQHCSSTFHQTVDIHQPQSYESHAANTTLCSGGFLDQIESNHCQYHHIQPLCGSSLSKLHSDISVYSSSPIKKVSPYCIFY